MLFAGAAFGAFGSIRQELTPTEDRSVVLLRINAPQGVSLDYTTQQMRRIEELIQPLRDSGEIVSTFANAGQDGAYNCGFMVMTLAPWDQRERSQQQIMADINQLVEAGAGRARLPGAAEQPRHPRRRQRPAVRVRRQRPARS